MALNAVMLERGLRNPVPLPNENFLYHCNGVKFDLKIGDGYPGNSVAYQSPSGTAFISNQRIVFLSQTATAETSASNSAGPNAVSSFTIPHGNVRDQKFTQPIFGANRFEALAIPVAGGGVPSNAMLTLTFKEGGGFDFATIARKMSERIQETGEIPAHEEELPAYRDGAVPAAASHPDSGLPGYPSDAPPGYEQFESRS
ncbi:hypothetical protein GQ54DRAFT_257490 [Martensiomyces pterosporus]|nr:hypothetical protein GQ54DRAFT_257490 [Martensiomyces pterosporus]